MRKAAPEDCHVLLERLSAYLDGDLPGLDCRRIEAHARRCGRCAEVLEDLRKTTQLCRQAAGQPLPAAVRRSARDRIKRLLG